MKKWFKSNLFWKVTALALAIITWFYVKGEGR